MVSIVQAPFIGLYNYHNNNTIRLRWEEKKMIEITYFFFINGLNLVIIWLIWYETPVICRKNNNIWLLIFWLYYPVEHTEISTQYKK